MRRLIATAALIASALALGACHNPNPGKHEPASGPVGTAHIAANDAPNCKPVACTPAGGLSGSTAGGGSSSHDASAASNASSGGGDSSDAGSGATMRRAHAAHSRHGAQGWNWRAQTWRAKQTARPGPSGSSAHAWRQEQASAGGHGWSRVHPRQGWARSSQYASGYGADRDRSEQRWSGRTYSRGGAAHYGYLDEPTGRGAYDDRYASVTSMHAGALQARTVTRYYGERRVVSPAPVCAPGAWLSPAGRCVFARRTAEVSVPGSFFYDNGGVGSDVVSGGGGGGGFIYGGSSGFGRSSASAFASAHAYASARASVHVGGGSHGGGHGGHGGGCGCGGKH